MVQTFLVHLNLIDITIVFISIIIVTITITSTITVITSTINTMVIANLESVFQSIVRIINLASST